MTSQFEYQMWVINNNFNVSRAVALIIFLLDTIYYKYHVSSSINQYLSISFHIAILLDHETN